MGEGEEGRRTNRLCRRRLLQGSQERDGVAARGAHPGTSEQVRGVWAARRFRAFPSLSARKPRASGVGALVDRLEGQVFQAQILQVFFLCA